MHKMYFIFSAVCFAGCLTLRPGCWWVPHVAPCVYVTPTFLFLAGPGVPFDSLAASQDWMYVHVAIP